MGWTYHDTHGTAVATSSTLLMQGAAAGETTGLETKQGVLMQCVYTRVLQSVCRFMVRLPRYIACNAAGATAAPSTDRQAVAQISLLHSAEYEVSRLNHLKSGEAATVNDLAL